MSRHCEERSDEAISVTRGQRLLRPQLRGLAMTARLRWLTVTIALVLPAAALAQGVDSAPPPADTLGLPTGPLRPGDLLNLRVYRDSELTGKYLIDARGNVQIPGLGVLRVAGLTPPAASDRLTQALLDRGFKAPEIAVWPEIRISVLGEVRAPGLYSVAPGASLIEVVTLAGGPMPRANLSHAQIVRSGHVQVVDLRQAIGEGKRRADSTRPSATVPLFSNDVVFLPTKHGIFTAENMGLVAGFLSLILSAVTLIEVVK